MKPVNNGGHPAYQDRVLTQLHKYYPDADTSFDTSTWEVMEQFWSLDLSPVDQIMQDRYSVFGPEPRLPSDMLRSYLLSMKFKVTSLTAWASSLKQNYLYAILSGFLSEILRVLVPSTTLPGACGSQIRTTFPIRFILQRRSPKSQRRKAKRLPRSKR